MPPDLKKLIDKLDAVRKERLKKLDALKRYAANHRLEFFQPHPKQREFFSALNDYDVKVVGFQGGNRCLGGDQPIDDAWSGRSCRISEITGPHWVEAYDEKIRDRVKVIAGRPFRKAKDRLYRVEFEAGGEIEASAAHQVLADSGQYVSVMRAFKSKIPLRDCGRIVAMDYLRFDWVWDFTVPKYHNYVLEGAIHHNSGKTTSLIAATVALLRGEYPWDHKRTRFRPPVRARLVGEDQGHHLREILVPKLREAIPPEWIVSCRKNNQGLDTYWTIRAVDGSESTLELMSYEQDTDIFEGWSGHFVGADEPMPRDKYIALKRGLVDLDGLFMMTFTPLKEPWIYDELVTNPDKRIRFINAEITDNPFLDPKAIAEFSRSLTEEERTSRLKGGWLFLQGLVYKEFNKQTHVVPKRPIPPDYSCYVAIDTHPRTEQAVLFAAVDDKDRIFIVDERFSFGTPQEVADWIIDFHRNTHPIDGLAIIDPSSQGDQNRGDTTYDLIERRLAQFGICLETGSKDLSGGILKVRDALCSRNGLPSLFVYENCTRTIFEFGRYIWDDWKDDRRTDKQKPRDKDDHMMENVRRLIQHPAQYRNKSALSDYLRQANAGYAASDPRAGY